MPDKPRPEGAVSAATKTTEQFIAKARQIHGGTYDYSNTVYTGAQSNCTIRCPIHGLFTLRATEHVNNSRGCPQCGVARRTQLRKQLTGWVLDHQQLAARLSVSHGDRYHLLSGACDGAGTPLRLLCADHGEFTRPAREVLAKENPRGCPACGLAEGALKRRYTQDQFIAAAASAHHGKYDYSATKLADLATPITVVCPEHGPYTCLPRTHLYGRGVCHSCVFAERTKTTSAFVAEAVVKHASRYDYSQTTYTKAHNFITIVCPKHGPFTAAAYQHLSGGGTCPRCGDGGTSQMEKAMATHLAALRVPMQVRTKRVIPPQELDFYFPSRQVAVELCGLYWHSEGRLGRNYHRDKLAKVNEHGIRLITLFEDEWLTSPELVMKTISRALGSADLKPLGARHTALAHLPHSAVAPFYQANHLMGAASASLHLALLADGEIVSAASFSRPRAIFGGGRPDTSVELVRFCSAQNFVVHGALAKLCNAAGRHYPAAQQILSYVDLRWFTGSACRAAGFIESGRSAPGYYYVKGQRRHHRFQFAKHRLSRLLPRFDPELSEAANMAANGYQRIYDCGQLRMVKPIK